MIFDKQALFSDKQPLAGSGALNSEQVIDRGRTDIPVHATAAWPYDDGKGTKVPLRIQIVETAAGGTDLTVIVQVSATDDFTSPREVARSAAIPVADLTAGFVFNFDTVPLGTNERYVRVVYSRSGTFTAGAVTAGIVLGNDQWYM